jgi:hypothetical protein
MGVEDQALYWIKSYLSSRKQSCFVDGELSVPLHLLDCGVPQASIGGPLLWLCFTCDQPDVIHGHQVDGQELHRGCGGHAVSGDGRAEQDHQVPVLDAGDRGLVHEEGVNGRDAAEVQEEDCGELVGYVDDGAYSFAHVDPTVLSRVLTEKYNMLEDWMNNNMLVINPDKTHLMVMGTRKTAARRQQVSMMAGTYVISPPW